MKNNILLYIIFALALLVRFYDFSKSVYFGYDEARDAIVSQAIYKQADFKIVGPAANGVTGLNHGVLHWYLIGVIYLVGFGNPFFASGIFRIINAIAVFPVFWISNKLFNRRVAYLASLFFAVSFEATQYALYFGNPSLAIFSWIIIFIGASLIYKSKNKFWGLPLMAIGVSTGVQFELFLVTLFPLSLIILFILRRYLNKITFKSWAIAIILGLSIVSTYIIGELKNNFRSINILLNFDSLSTIANNNLKWSIYVNRWMLMLHDNFAPLDTKLLYILALGVLFLLITKSFQKKVEYQLILLWILGGLILTFIGSYNSYYVNVGIGTGLIISIAIFINKVFELNKYLAIFLVIISLFGNLYRIKNQNKNGLIEDIKTQQFMSLKDEIDVINKIYSLANNRPFTLRITSMPYRVQTVWAYLFNQFGLPVYGYLPYLETGNVLGFEGYLPQPKSGTTCSRFLLKEPNGGIPKVLFIEDEVEEESFSSIIETYKIGHFVIQNRLSKDKKCLSNNFPSL